MEDNTETYLQREKDLRSVLGKRAKAIGYANTIPRMPNWENEAIKIGYHKRMTNWENELRKLEPPVVEEVDEVQAV